MLLIFCSLFISSCSNDFTDDFDSNGQQVEVSSFEKLEAEMSIKERMKLDFARKLAIAVSENPEIRLFLKTEALKMINNDYDVFYPIAKKKKINSSLSKSSVQGSSPLEIYCYSILKMKVNLLKSSSSYHY